MEHYLQVQGLEWSFEDGADVRRRAAFDAVAASAVEPMPWSTGETTTTPTLLVRWQLA